ncbi:MAG: aldo/keto reductase [Burkholderiaceae bacterium]|jgi:2,5-diketo-D-gluconate reductase A
MTKSISTLELHDGKKLPQLGLGSWQISTEAAPDVLASAFRVGYRLVDTAPLYENEAGVGKGVRESDLPRGDLFVTTKLWNDSHGHELTRMAFMKSLERLQLDYVDLYLIHWPVPRDNLYVQAWETLIQLRDEGLAKSIGVCNFNIPHLERLLDETGVLPVLNQIELHPGFQQAELRAFHNEHDIVTQAWSPLGQGHFTEHPVLLGLSRKHGRSVAQVILRWHIQLGNAVIPKSVNATRLVENFRIGDFELSDDDMAEIAALDNATGRLGPDPELFRLPKKS